MSDHQVHSISFDPDGALFVAYMTLPDDVRVKGTLLMNRQLRIDPANPDYAELIDGLKHKVGKILRDVLEDYEASEPWIPDAPEDEDSDSGMGE